MKSLAPALPPTQSEVSPRLLDARDIRKSFGGVHAVRGVDLHVNTGEIVGLIGPNGSGKSTLLGCISRDLKVDEGEIELGGHDITRLGAAKVARRGLGRTFQNVRVFSELSVRENAMLARNWSEVSPMRMLRAPEQACIDRVEHLLELTEMTRLSREVAGNLSGGQKRLLEFVMALVSQPSLVLLDEAASGVNPALVDKLKGYVELLRREEQVAFLIVEHNVDFIFSIADRIVVMESGAVLAQGTPEEIQNNQEVIHAYLGA